MVVGMRLGLEVLGTDLDPDGEGGRGHTHFAPPGPWFRPRAGHLKARERDLVERVITTFMAGFAAEVRLGAADPDGSGYDVDRTLREWVAYLEPVAARRPALAQRFLARAVAELEAPGCWRAVEDVAAALLRQGRLSEMQARDVVEPTPH